MQPPETMLRLTVCAATEGHAGVNGPVMWPRTVLMSVAMSLQKPTWMLEVGAAAQSHGNIFVSTGDLAPPLPCPQHWDTDGGLGSRELALPHSSHLTALSAGGFCCQCR